jgi:dephospho-CoA kinase
MLVGLTGTFGSGKSFVGAILAECGARVIDADAIVREVVAPGTGATEEIRREFGDEYLLPDGRIDRKRMAQTVFSSPQARRKLNAIVHPRVIERMNKEIERLESALPNEPKIIVLDVPLLFEAGLADAVERIAVVTVCESERFRRVRLRDGLGERETVDRLAAQWPQRRKASLADFVVDNSGSADATRSQVLRMYEQWLSSAKPNG